MAKYRIVMSATGGSNYDPKALTWIPHLECDGCVMSPEDCLATIVAYSERIEQLEEKVQQFRDRLAEVCDQRDIAIVDVAKARRKAREYWKYASPLEQAEARHHGVPDWLEEDVIYLKGKPIKFVERLDSEITDDPLGVEREGCGEESNRDREQGE